MSKIDPEAQKRANTKRTTGLPTEVAMWLTPNVPNGGRSVPEALVQSKGMTEDGEKRTVGLESQRRYWATPQARDTKSADSADSADSANYQRKLDQGYTIDLNSQASNWPTPTSSQPGGTAEAHVTRKLKSMGRTHATVTDLGMMAQQFQPVSARPTPAARDAKGPNSEAHVTTNGTGRMHMDQLANFAAYSPQVQQTPDGEPSSPSTPNSRRHLNPLFGSWLMGWPSTWVIAEPHASSALATASFHCALQQRLSYFFDGQAL